MKPSPSMVVALIALFIACTGVATAQRQVKVKIPANSIGSAQLKPNSVGAPQLKPNSVKPQELAPNAVQSQNLAPGSVQTPALGSEAVTSGKIDQLAVLNQHIANLALTPEKLARTFPAVGVTTSADVVVPTGGGFTNPIQFNVESWDSRSMHDVVVNNDRIVFPVSGIYRITANVSWLANAGSPGVRRIALYANNSLLAQDRIGNRYDYNITDAIDQQLTVTTYREAGEYFKLYPMHGSDQAVTIDQQAGESPLLQVEYISPGPE